MRFPALQNAPNALSLAGVAAALAASDAAAPTQAHISLAVDAATTYQTIDGFGFCEAFQRAHAIGNLPAAPQAAVLDLLFNATAGAGFSILRLGLGSSPDSRGDHMNSPQPAADPAAGFAWDGDDSGQVWVAQQAANRYGVATFYADAWSAPGYMKTNGRDDQGGWLCGVRGEGSAAGTLCAGASWVQAYAEYLARYVQAYIGAGIPVAYLGFLNEPNLIKPYATMQSDGYQAAEVAEALSVSLGGLGLSGVQIACCDAQGWSMARTLLAEMQDAGAEDLISVVTTHTYKGAPAGPDGPLNTTARVWVTEISPIMQRLGMTQTWFRNGSENEGLTWAVNLHEAFAVGNASAYIYWIGVGQANGTAPADNSTVPYYTIGSTYWASAHFSRFIRPGAKRIRVEVESMEGSNPGTADTTGTNVLASAYANKDSSIVVQVVNNRDQDVTADVPVAVPAAQSITSCEADTWVTDNTKKFVKVDAGMALRRGMSILLPSRSLTTVVVKCR
ncbi:glycoside hydrolase family 30 protein [Lasiosphaeria ovina]|uniref:Glycoside hydrolase family 30 protein n=1 Tax=Lasiosphaeria ovina TaxID=92902 RepID=A0AAE0NA19_9PEZI|nr:glycoside hydrolase family 30 protein [Lasiosphaeria ovina]